MENILKSTKSLSLEHELNDFTSKIKDLIDLKKKFLEKTQTEENLQNELTNKSEELLESSSTLKKQCDQSFYQLSLALAEYEDHSYEVFSLSQKDHSDGLQQQQQDDELPISSNNLQLDRLVQTVKGKINTIKAKINQYKGIFQERVKVHKILNNEEDLSALLDTMGKRMEFIDQQIRLMEDSISSINENQEILIQKGIKEAAVKVDLSSSSRWKGHNLAAKQQRKIWKQMGHQLKQKYRPCLSLALFEECLEEISSSIDSSKQIPVVATNKNANEERRKQIARQHFLNQSSPHGKNKAENFQIVSPEFGDWSYISSPVKSDKPPSLSKLATSRSLSKAKEFDDSISPLRTVLDKVDQLQYTKVVKETAGPSPASKTPSTLTPPAQVNPVASSSPLPRSFGTGATVLETESKRKPFAFDGIALPEASPVINLSGVSAPDAPKYKTNRRLALDLEEEEDKKESTKSTKLSLPPETLHSPLTLPLKKTEEATTSEIKLSAKPNGNTVSTPSTVLNQIKELYTKYNPEKLTDLPKLLAKYDGRYDELYSKLVQKYAPKESSNAALGPASAFGSARSGTPANPSQQQHAPANPAQSQVHSAQAAPQASTNFGFGTSSVFGNKPNTTTGTTPSLGAATNPANTNTTTQPAMIGSVFSGNKAKSPFSANTTPSTTATSTLFGAQSGLQQQSTTTINNSTNLSPNNSTAGNKFFQIVQEIYVKYNPTKLDNIPAILSKYEGKELELITTLKKKYNINEPLQSEAALLGGMTTGNSLQGTNTPSSLFGQQNTGFNAAPTGFNAAPTANTLFGGPKAPTTPFSNQTNTNTLGFNNNTPLSFNSNNLQSMGMGGGGSSLFGQNSGNSTIGMNTSVNNTTTGGGIGIMGASNHIGGRSPFATSSPTFNSAIGSGNTLFSQSNNISNTSFGQGFATNQQPNTLFGNLNNNASTTNINAVRNRVLDIYKQFNPAKIAEIPKLLEKYQGREQELIAKLEQRYGASNGNNAGTVMMGNNNGSTGMAFNPVNQGFGNNQQIGGGVFGNSNNTSGFGNNSSNNSSIFNQSNTSFGGLNQNSNNSGGGGSTLFGNANRNPTAGFAAPTSTIGGGSTMFGQTSNLGGGFGGNVANNSGGFNPTVFGSGF